jgi:hypothetical protein
MGSPPGTQPDGGRPREPRRPHLRHANLTAPGGETTLTGRSPDQSCHPTRQRRSFMVPPAASLGTTRSRVTTVAESHQPRPCRLGRCPSPRLVRTCQQSPRRRRIPADLLRQCMNRTGPAHRRRSWLVWLLGTDHGNRPMACGGHRRSGTTTPSSSSATHAVSPATTMASGQEKSSW